MSDQQNDQQSDETTAAEQKTPPPSAAEQPPVVARPGKAHADAAYRAGREDEYIDLMKARYGGEW